MRIPTPIGRFARSVGIVRPVPGEGFEFRKAGMKGTDDRSSPSGAMRSRPWPGRFAFFTMVTILAACMHEPVVSPGETIHEDDGDAVAESRAMDTCDRTIVRAEPEVAPIFVQH